MSELDDVMAYGVCWCGRARRFEMQLYVEDDAVVWKTALMCYAGHESP